MAFPRGSGPGLFFLNFATPMKQLTEAEHQALLRGAVASITTEADLLAQAEALAARAVELGYNLIIEQRPMWPLAQGNYRNAVTLQPRQVRS